MMLFIHVVNLNMYVNIMCAIKVKIKFLSQWQIDFVENLIAQCAYLYQLLRANSL